MKRIKIYLITIVCLVLGGCNACDWIGEPIDELDFDDIDFENLSGETVLVVPQFNKLEFQLKEISEEYFVNASVVVGHQTTLYVCEIPEKYKGVCCLYIYREDTVNKYTTAELLENNMYDDLIIYTYDELKDMNFTIVYTGD